MCLVDASAGRRVPKRRRELERAAVRHGKKALRASLPIRRRSHDQRPIVILERPRHDLRRARAGAVYEDDDRDLWPWLRPPVDVIAVRVLRPTAHAHDLLPWIEKEIGDRDALVKQTAGIAPKVEHEGPHAAAAQ